MSHLICIEPLHRVSAERLTARMLRINGQICLSVLLPTPRGMASGPAALTLLHWDREACEPLVLDADGALLATGGAARIAAACYRDSGELRATLTGAEIVAAAGLGDGEAPTLRRLARRLTWRGHRLGATLAETGALPATEVLAAATAPPWEAVTWALRQRGVRIADHGDVLEVDGARVAATAFREAVFACQEEPECVRRWLAHHQA